MLDLDFSKEDSTDPVESWESNDILNKIEISKSELKLNAVDGVYEFNGEAFTGIANLLYPTGVLAERSEYLNGKRHGFYQKSFDTGETSFEAHFDNGLRKGVARSWWSNE